MKNVDLPPKHPFSFMERLAVLFFIFVIGFGAAALVVGLARLVRSFFVR